MVLHKAIRYIRGAMQCILCIRNSRRCCIRYPIGYIEESSLRGIQKPLGYSVWEVKRG